ncbi:MAG: sensor domain-containing diguanylate cyclase [Actinomycetota bacterium]|nr:sensor domain-containing diguanylate cyclase [Actinomycetota bacterium]
MTNLPGLDFGPAPRLMVRHDGLRVVSSPDIFADAVEDTAEVARRELHAASLSIGRVIRATGVLRTLINVGRLGPGEQVRPVNDTYSIRDYPRGDALFAGVPGVGFVTDAFAADADPGEMSLLRALGKSSSLEVPIVLDGRTWGVLWASRDSDQQPFDASDLELAARLASRIATCVTQVEYVDKVARLAYEDSLTGLANRRAADERLEQALERHRTEGAAVSLVVCDVNDLKQVNDERGHSAGDVVLIDIAEALRVAASSLPGCLAARLGGDEFCIVLDGHGIDAALDLAQYVCELTAHLSGEAQVSCGVAGTDGALPAQSPSSLLRLADGAQYRAKRTRSTMPVVAGREPVMVDPTTALDPHGDRRQLRGRRRVDRGRLLDVGLRCLDEVRGSPTRTRLESVTETCATHLDAAGWCVSHAPAGATRLDTVGAAAYRGSWQGRSDWQAAIALRSDPGAHHLTAGAVAGGGYVAFPDGTGPDGSGADGGQGLLADTSYTALVAAGGTNTEGGWLVRIFTDELGAPIEGMASTLRALVAVALTG